MMPRTDDQIDCDHDLLTKMNGKVDRLCKKVDELRKLMPKVYKHEERIIAVESNQQWINRILTVVIIGYVLKGALEYLL
jgi:hypothetical protein